ncbi:MAG: phage shock protein PspA [Candidatus Hydrogenedentes bacterium]|nr:phage shock protein PspA [Candidatus Hydrogenedentota bacterium]
MGIFTRVRDIISANLNSMLDGAEDPEKMVKLIIREMEDTLIEIKANCARAMATKKKIQREREEMQELAKNWEGKAQLAINKGREDLAREALYEKRRYNERAEALVEEFEHAQTLVTQCQEDITQLEDKLNGAREKQRVLIQRHHSATNKKRAQQTIRKYDTSESLHRFEAFQQKIDRMEAEANLVNYGRKGTLVDEFAALEKDEDIEKELADLKARTGHGSGGNQG